MSPDDDEQLFQFDSCDSTDKGKQRSLPMPIVVDSHDVFHGAALISSPSSSSYRAFGSPSSSAAFSPTSFTFSSPDSYHRYASRNRSDESMDQQPPSGFSPKGKARATPIPTLPPLSFQPIELDPLRAMGSATPAHDADDLEASSSNLSRQRFQQTNTHGLAELSVEDDSNLQYATPEDAVPIDPSAWYTLPRSPELNLPIHQLPNSTNGDFVLKSSVRALYRSKGRSKSSPFPLSALDFVPASDADVIQPLPLVISNYFDLALPKELRIRVLQALLQIHEDEHRKQVEEGRISFAKATSSRGRWVGRDKGIRELFKLTRVSKGWQELVFDGQLWADFDLHSFPTLPPHILVRLVQIIGTFTTRIDLAGHVHILPDNMADITSGLSLKRSDAEMSYNQLTSINLQGCTSLTTRSLHHLLVRSRSLDKLIVKGLSAVTNTTCDILATCCPLLTSLNISRCPNVTADGIRSLSLAAIERHEVLALKELRACGLKHLSDNTMALLGRAAPHLEVLDLSYARQLHNSALDAFVACGIRDIDTEYETVVVGPRDLGRELNDGTKLRRRVTKLKHLCLSSCLLLTDTACSNLSYSVPHLEILELAGIGTDLKDAGLIRLLSTTPHIRRLDLEDAADITNAVLTTITPIPEHPLTQPISPSTGSDFEAGELGFSPPIVNVNPPPQLKQPGHALETLIISYASQISDDALLSLIRNCPKLVHLEVDNTRIGAGVLREFMRLSRQRKAINAKISATDCRGIGESLVKELSPMTRPRMGWRAHGARKLHYLDARDDNEDELRVGQDECDESRVVIKTFYSWQTVDAVKAAREKRRRKSNMRRLNGSDASVGHEESAGTPVRSTRWWSPGGRRATVVGNTRTIGMSRSSSPSLSDFSNIDGCVMM